MKFTKLSLAALAVVGFSSSAVALDLSGTTFSPFVKTKLYYETVKNDKTNAPDLFDQKTASGGALVSAGATGKLDSCWGYGLEYTAVDTLGLENNLVSNTRMGNGIGRTILDTQHWASQAYVTYSPCDTFLSNTTFKIGRQYLDTPLAFTEDWNLAPNSFDAVVVLNQDIKDVTLVGAYVGRGNGVVGDVLAGTPGAIGRVTNGDRFEPYAVGGAYAVGAVTNLMEGLPINAWYYNVHDVAQAAWFDGAYTLNFADDMNVGLGAQYGMMMPDAENAEDGNGFAVKASGKVSMFNVLAAYSSIDEDGALPLANTATGFKKTKLYTAGVWTDGTAVAMPGSDTIKVQAGVDVADIGNVSAHYVMCENETNRNVDVDEIALMLGTKIAGIGAKAFYINRDFDKAATTSVDQDIVRLILSRDF